MNNNPWQGLTSLTQLRVKGVSKHSIYWIADILSRYGLMIQCKESSFTEEHLIKLKGIQVELDTTTSPNKLILLLNDKGDVEIFEVLCRDLISVASSNPVDSDMISKIAQRLLRWKKLLQNDLKYTFSSQKQMGLFGELTFIQLVLGNEVGFEEAIKTWNGPLYNKQDFILEKTAAEIKTYNTAKEKIIEISSKEQLYSSKENLILAAFAVSENKAGYTVKDLIDEISNQISSDSVNEMFIAKVEGYGYIPELVREPLVSFIVDETNYYKVNDDFPRIIPGEISTGIQRVKYTIDLNTCNSFEINEEELKF